MIIYIICLEPRNYLRRILESKFHKVTKFRADVLFLTIITANFLSLLLNFSHGDESFFYFKVHLVNIAKSYRNMAKLTERNKYFKKARFSSNLRF